MEIIQDESLQFFSAAPVTGVWEPIVIVGKQREKTKLGYVKRNISRSSCMGNPHIVVTDEFPTEADASIAYIETLFEQLSDYDSPQYE